MNLVKSIGHNLDVVIVGFGFASLGRALDFRLGVARFRSAGTAALGGICLMRGFLIRVWAALLFYKRQMKVIWLAPQCELITTGPYRFSRNPLYLGGNLFLFFGAVLLRGSPSGLILTALNLLGADRMIRREETQLQREFGDEWAAYAKNVRRWL